MFQFAGRGCNVLILVQISAACIAASFLVLVVYMIVTLQTARSSLKQMNETLDRLESRVNEIGTESVKLMHTSQNIAADVQKKMNAIDNWFQSLVSAGDSVSQMTRSMKQMTSTVADTFRKAGEQASRQQQQTAELMEWATVGYQLWRKWQSRKRQNDLRPDTENGRNDHDGKS
jgi:uncharacterized protein YoxC